MISQYDNFHGDEHECRGSCGLCYNCEQASDERAEYEYEQWYNEEAA